MRRSAASFLSLALLLVSSAVLAASAPAMIVPGQFNVGATGAATYTIPIAVPPGTAGMVPALSLNYSSQGGDGIVGIGWSLSGLPSISRCPRTLAQDGVHGSVNYDTNDRLCLDGKRLVYETGGSGYGTDGSLYHTEIESFSKIVQHNDINSGDVYFEVWTKAGQRMLFGDTIDSRIFTVGLASNVTRAWAVSKISDTVSNYLTVTYNCAPVDSSGCTDPDRVDYGEAYPLQIDYTGNAAAGVSPYNSVRLVYSCRGGTPPCRGDVVPQYQAGANTRTTVLLTNLQTYQGNNLVQDYRLAYRMGTSVTRSRLTSVSLCDRNGACLMPTTFGWQGGSGTLTASNTTNPLGAPTTDVLVGAEFNGDGNTDVALVTRTMTAGCPDYPIYLWNGSGFSPSSLTLPNPANSSTADNCTFDGSGQTMLAPNGLSFIQLDFKADFDTMLPPPDPYSIIYRSFLQFGVNPNQTVNGLSPPAPITSMGDFNGDGYIDLLFAFSPNYQLSLGNGTSTWPWSATPTHYDHYLGAADFDGDGCTDYVGINTMDTEPTVNYSSQCNPAVVTATYPQATGYTSHTGDFNGDGKMDALLINVSTATGQLWLGTGIGFIQANSAISGPVSWTGYTVSVGDWNGDGRSDVVWLPNTGAGPTTAQLFLSTGTDFAVARDGSGNAVAITTGGSRPSTLGDWNNDGATDIWFQDISSNDELYTFGYVPELMVSVSNGIGSTTNVTYDRLNKNGAFYAKGSTAKYPTLDVDGPLYVVKRVDASDGLGTCNPSVSYTNCYSSTYAYAGAQSDLRGRGFLGFATVAITDLQTDIVQTTSYSTTFPLVGLITSQTKKRTGKVHDLSSVENTYASNSSCWLKTGPPSGVYEVCLTQSEAAGYDLDDTSQLPTTTTSYSYDDYGNALTVNVSVLDHTTKETSTKNTTNTYTNDTTNWFLGRLTATSVYSVVGTSKLTRTSSFAYDSSTGLLNQEVVEPGVNACNNASNSCTLTTSYTFDAFGHRVTTTISGSGIATRTSSAYFDANGTFMTRAVNALGQEESWTYDPMFGGPLSQTGPNGLTTTWSYDSYGRLLQEVRPDGTRTQQSYLYCGCSGVAHGQFFSQSQNLGANGLQIGATSTAYYDMLSRAIAADTQGFDGSVIRSATEYDGDGRIGRTSRPYFLGGSPKWTSFVYDDLGRVVQTTAPDGSISSACYGGLNTWSQDALGGTIETMKNAQGLNKLVARGTYACGANISTNPLKTSYEYDAFGNLTKVTDASGNVVSSSYDIRGHKYSNSDPDMGTWTYVHDVLGQLTSQTDAKGQTTTLTYDVLGRMTVRNESGLYSTWTFGNSLSARNVGKLVEAKACTSSGTCTLVSQRLFQYDSLGRPRLTQLRTATDYFAYTQRYDSQSGRLSLVNYPSGLVVRHIYNQYGYLCRLTDYNYNNPTCTTTTGAKVFWTANARDAELHLTQSTAGNGIVLTQDFDPDTGLIKEQRAGLVTGPAWNTLNWNTPPPNTWGGPSVAAFSYSFDAIGRLNSRTDSMLGFIERYCYDAMNQLTNSATGGAGVLTCTSSGAGITTKSVGYDILSNITSKSDVGTYAYPASGPTSTRPHAIDRITGTAGGLSSPYFQYDNNGNPLCMSTGSGCTGTVGRQVSYTAFNMTGGITDAGTSLSLTYDSEHARIRQSSTISGTTTVTDYLNDPASGAMSQRVTVGSGTPSFVDYITADGLIVAQQTTTYATAAMWGVAQWNSFNWGGYSTVTQWNAFSWNGAPWNGTMTPPTVATVYFINDHLGSVAVVMDQAGAVVQRLSYDAWGKQRNPDGTDAACGAITSPTTRGFTNQEQMPASCLVNLNARLYDSEIGKFMTPDPVVGSIFLLNGFNRYAYVLNNPLSFTDPTGLCFLGCFWESDIFIAIIGVAVAVLVPAAFFSFKFAALTKAVAAGTGLGIGSVALGGALSGAITAGLSGGDILEGALFGGLSGAAFAGLAPALGGAINGAIGSAFGSGVPPVIGEFVAAGFIGGTLSAAQGGDFGSGFLAAGIGSLAGQFSRGQFDAGKMLAGAALGGAASVLGGGKFENGAATATFSYVVSSLGRSDVEGSVGIRIDQSDGSGFSQIASGGSAPNIQHSVGIGMAIGDMMANGYEIVSPTGRWVMAAGFATPRIYDFLASKNGVIFGVEVKTTNFDVMQLLFRQVEKDVAVMKHGGWAPALNLTVNSVYYYCYGAAASCSVKPLALMQALTAAGVPVKITPDSGRR